MNKFRKLYLKIVLWYLGVCPKHDHYKGNFPSYCYLCDGEQLEIEKRRIKEKYRKAERKRDKYLEEYKNASF